MKTASVCIFRGTSETKIQALIRNEPTANLAEAAPIRNARPWRSRKRVGPYSLFDGRLRHKLSAMATAAATEFSVATCAKAYGAAFDAALTMRERA